MGSEHWITTPLFYQLDLKLCIFLPDLYGGRQYCNVPSDRRWQLCGNLPWVAWVCRGGGALVRWRELHEIPCCCSSSLRTIHSCLLGPRPSSSMSTGRVMPLRGDWAIFCHAGSKRVGRVRSTSSAAGDWTRATERTDNEINLFSHKDIMADHYGFIGWVFDLTQNYDVVFGGAGAMLVICGSVVLTIPCQKAYHSMKENK